MNAESAGRPIGRSGRAPYISKVALEAREAQVLRICGRNGGGIEKGKDRALVRKILWLEKTRPTTDLPTVDEMEDYDNTVRDCVVPTGFEVDGKT